MAKKVKFTKADFNRSWGIPPHYKLRYSGIVGVLWYYLSIQVRTEDFVKYGGQCVSCSKVLTDWRNGDCGHMLASGKGGFITRFMRENLALQCKQCNNPKWTPDASAFFAIEINKRYGPGTAERILAMKGTFQKEMTKVQYEEAIRALPSYVNNCL